MKRVITILSAIFISFIATSSFAAMKIFSDGPTDPLVGKEFVGKIVAAYYYLQPKSNSQFLHVVAKTDSTFKNNNLIGGVTMEFTDKDLQMGMALAANLGKGVAVAADPSTGNIDTVNIITHEYWNGPKK